MNIVRVVLIAVEIISCLLLIGVILLQQSKSSGMGVAFGGGMSDAIFGSRAGNILTKATITLTVVFLANTTLLGIMFTTKSENSLVDTAAVPAAAPVQSAGPIAGGGQVPAPTQRGTLFTPDQEVAAPVESEVIEAVAVGSDSGDSVMVDETIAVEETPVVEESAPVAP